MKYGLFKRRWSLFLWSLGQAKWTAGLDGQIQGTVTSAVVGIKISPADAVV